jgi:anti-anti-sigma regulatory factor
MGGDLEVEIDGAVVTVHGDVDMATSHLLVDALDTVGGSPTVDLEGVTFLDSSGINVCSTPPGEPATEATT